MKSDPFTHKIRSDWGRDTDTPDQIGARALAMIEQLSTIDPAMSNWQLLDFVALMSEPLAEIGSGLTAFVENNIRRDDDGEPDPDSGYQLVARGAPVASQYGSPQTTDVTVIAGCKWDNGVSFEIGGDSFPADPALVTYPIYRQAIEAIVSTWPAPWATAYAFRMDYDEVQLALGAPLFPYSLHHVAWIGYLSAPLAAGLVPPPELVCEPTPGGGMILSAVRERLDPTRPDHLRRARALTEIMTERAGDGGPMPTWGPREGPY